MNAIWNHLKDGIHFENTDTVIPWNITVEELKYKNGEVVEGGGRIKIVWKDTILLDGIRGDWTISYYLHETTEKIKSVNLFYTGDEQSLEAYHKLSQHLFEKLGKPVLQNQNAEEKELKWQSDDLYIYLYFFEMHSYRCSLTVGKAK